jgi:FixJ family two-component response regulator
LSSAPEQWAAVAFSASFAAQCSPGPTACRPPGLTLPDRRARQLAEALTARWQEMKVLFMTGYSRNAIVHHGRLDPGVNLLQKPVSTAELVRKVREVLRTVARPLESSS